MPCRSLITPYGRAAAAALHGELAAAKREDPLAPVTVVVPANSVGVAARRLLASGDLGPVTARGTGIVGVSFLTVYRLAELLGAPALAAAGRRPVSTPVVAAAVRGVLTDRPGVFAPVAAHPATEEALVAVHRELSDLDPADLDRLAAQGRRAADVVRIHRAVGAALAGAWYDERDLMRAAEDAVVGGSPLVTGLGTVLVHLPQRLGAPATALLRALAEVGDVAVVLGLTGDPRADAVPRATAAKLGIASPDAGEGARPAPPAPPDTTVLTCSDPDDEVRHVVRGVVDAMRSGVALERMAVLYGTDAPYARLLHEHLDLAGVTHHGASVRSLRECALGRALLALLALADRDFRRADVFRLLTMVPVRGPDGRRVPVAAWERIARDAGVIGGASQWRDRLAASEAEAGDDERWAERRGRIAALAAFVAALERDLAPHSVPASWSGKVRWAHALVRRWFGSEQQRGRWPAGEQDAARRVEAALDRLAGLDELEAAPDLAVFRRTLELELDATRERVGRLGDGLLVGRVTAALGVDVDRVWICGLAEGLLPSVPHDDPLLADRERAALGGALACRSDRVEDDHRAYLAALASAGRACVLCVPRGDLRRTTERVPSRFLLDTIEGVAGTRAVDEGASWCTPVASYVQGIARAAFPASEHEHDIRTVLAGGAAPTPQVARGHELASARRGRELTRFDGNLTEIAPRLRAARPRDAVVSPTALELYWACPHAYFLRQVLHVRVVEDPKDVLQLSPIDRGDLLHKVLHRYVVDGSRGRARLHEITDEECAGVEARGLSGHRVLWDRDRRRIHRELDAWSEADARFRADHRSTTVGTEVRFESVPVALPDGRCVGFRGSIDRVDRTATGALIVIDYKSGSDGPYSGLTAEDPVLEGRRLQLPVYAAAARHAFDLDAPVRAEYWFVGRGNDKRYGYDVDEGVEARFHDAVAAALDGIDAGCFPAVPDPPGTWGLGCAYCDPDGLGTTDRWREWQRKQGAADLAPYWRGHGNEPDGSAAPGAPAAGAVEVSREGRAS